MALLVAAADAKPGSDKRKHKGGAPAGAQQGNDHGGKDKPGKDKANKKIAGFDDKGRFDGNQKKGKIRFENRDRERIVRYFSGYRNHEHGLPPGLAKNLRRGKPLPPGWQKKISPGYVIEDEWWPAFQPLPYTWFPDLPVVPDTRLYWYGDRIVRVYEPRREVVDVVIVPTIRGDW